MNVSTLPTLKLLRISTILYMGTALLAGLVAVDGNLPAEFGGSHTELPVTQSFLYGMGTALSPPLSMLIIQFVLLLLAPRKDRWGSFAVLGLAITGLMTFIGALGEPINRIIFNPVTFDLIKAALMAGMILLPLAILLLGILEWSRRQQKKREYASPFNS
jgi:small-conductance mechanosensitive channel